MIADLEAFHLMQDAIKHWGEVAQIMMAIEESNELALVLCHSMRKLKVVKKEEIAKEISDVRLMTEQLQLIFDISDPYLEELRQKNLERLKELLKK